MRGIGRWNLKIDLNFPRKPLNFVNEQIEKNCRSGVPYFALYVIEHKNALREKTILDVKLNSALAFIEKKEYMIKLTC